MKIFILLVVITLLLLTFCIRCHISYLYSVAKARSKYTIDYTHSIENKDPITNAWYTQKIPFKIYQTSFSRKMDYSLSKTCLANHYINPEYEYYFYDDSDINDYMKKYFPQYLKHYNSIKPGAFKADLFRLLVLYREGGVYIDCKTSSVIPLREILRKDDELYMAKDMSKGCIYQGIICSVPGHELVKKFIDKYISNIESKYYGINCLDIGGPQMLGRVFNLHYGKDELSDIEDFDSGGVRISAAFRLLPPLIEVITSMDNKTVYFQRSETNYYKNKIKSVLNGKDYTIAWATGRAY